MNFPKITLKSKFPSQMLSQSPREGLPEDSPPFLEASRRVGFLYFHQLYFSISYFRFLDWHFLSRIACNWSMQPVSATISHFFSKYKYKDNDKYRQLRMWRLSSWSMAAAVMSACTCRLSMIIFSKWQSNAKSLAATVYLEIAQIWVLGWVGQSKLSILIHNGGPSL